MFSTPGQKKTPSVYHTDGAIFMDSTPTEYQPPNWQPTFVDTGRSHLFLNSGKFLVPFLPWRLKARLGSDAARSWIGDAHPSPDGDGALFFVSLSFTHVQCVLGEK
jgi:hypothetical protein